MAPGTPTHSLRPTTIPQAPCQALEPSVPLLTTPVQPGRSRRLTSRTRSDCLTSPHAHLQDLTPTRAGPTFLAPLGLSLSLALTAALSKQGGTGGGHSCRTPLKSEG